MPWARCCSKPASQGNVRDPCTREIQTGCIDDAAALPWRDWSPPRWPRADVYIADAERLAGEDWGLLPAAPLDLTAMRYLEGSYRALGLPFPRARRPGIV